MTTTFHLKIKPEDLFFFKVKKNGKAPCGGRGYKDADLSFNIEQIITTGFNVGLPMEPNGLIGIDMDVDAEKGYNGIETIANLEKELGPLPPTYTQRSPRRGIHKVYLDKNISNPIGKIGNDVDLKYRGYLLYNGSSINGNYYEAVDGVADDGSLIFSELPQKWIEYIEKGKTTNEYKTQKTNVHKKVYKGVDIDKMFNKCSFLSFCADEENASCLPEPMWHTMITCLSQIEGTEELIHKLSEPHHSYIFDETQKKIEYAQQFGHSQSCAYISDNYPEICKNCQSANKERNK